MNNLITRTISGIVFLAILISGIIFHPFGFGALFLFIIIVGLHEFYGMLLPKTFCIRKVLGYITAISTFSVFYAKNLGVIGSGYFWFLIIPVAALFIAELYSKSEKPFENIAYTLLGVIYIALPFSLVTELTFTEGNYDYRILLSFFIILWCNDVGAYCFGMLFGRSGKHKLFERISPKKSWEGFWGGVIVALAAGYILYTIWGEKYEIMSRFNFLQHMGHWIVMAAIVSIFGTFGDLTESMLKRSVGVKDSGKIMPGHGGILDRFDGALIAFPCAIAYLHIISIL